MGCGFQSPPAEWNTVFKTLFSESPRTPGYLFRVWVEKKVTPPPRVGLSPVLGPGGGRPGEPFTGSFQVVISGLRKEGPGRRRVPSLGQSAQFPRTRAPGVLAVRVLSPPLVALGRRPASTKVLDLISLKIKLNKP